MHDESQDLALTAESPTWYTIDSDNRLRWTDDGIADIAPFFARAGISWRNVISLDDWQAAMQAASPWLTTRLLEIAQRGQMNDERRALIATLKGDTEQSDYYIDRAKRKRAFRIVQ